MAILWQYVKHLTRKEFDDPFEPGSGDYMDGEVIFLADETRHRAGWKMIPHGPVGGCVDVEGLHGHSEKSYHRLDMGCKAFDFHFVTSASIRVQYHHLCLMGWTGIGFYPGWNNPGWHVDLRPVEDTQHWTRINGEYIYLLRGR